MDPRLQKIADDFKNVFSRLSKEEIAELNEKQARTVQESHARFSAAFEKGSCSICGKPLKTFCTSSPCVHWLLRPNGFKKKHLSVLSEKFGYFQIESYLKWVANTESLIKNINDLKEEQNIKKIFELTIRFQNLEWSFTCAPTDLHGHGGNHSNFPHYHMQMKIEGRLFISFGDAHLPFSEQDLFQLAMYSQDEIPVLKGYGPNAGFQAFMEMPNFAELMVETAEATSEPSEAAVNIETFVMAEPGKSISGDDIADLLEKSRETGETMAKLLRKLPNAKVTSIVSPGPGVPEMAKRKGGRGSKDDA